MGRRRGEKWLLGFSDWLAQKGRWRQIERPDLSVYLNRFYLFRTKLIGSYLHHLLRDDPDGLHCHPWASLSIVLVGGYWEHYHDGTRAWRGPGSIRFRTARELHRLTLTDHSSSWSLFIRFRRVRTWGFLPPGTEKDWREVEDRTW